MSRLTILESAVGASGPTTGASFSSLRFEQPHSIRRLLVSAFLADSIQHIHSLRARGVISSHAVNACGSDVSAFLKSAGSSCPPPLEIFLCDMYMRYRDSRDTSFAFLSSLRATNRLCRR